MKTYKSIFLLVLFFSFASSSSAMAPILSLGSVNSSSGQVTVYGDPNSSIELHYESLDGMRTAMIGATSANGLFSGPVSTSGYNISCGKTAYVIVAGQQSQKIPWTASGSDCAKSSSDSPSFSKNDFILQVGQSETVKIYGTGGYYISSNSNPNSVSTSFGNNEINLRALSFGVSKIKICENDGECREMNVTAISSNNQQNTNSGQKPAISSFSVFSNNANEEFATTGNTLTFGFNMNKPVKDVSVQVGYSRPAVVGSGSGTYMVTYSVASNEQSSIPVRINFTDLYGTAGQYSFSLSNTASVQPSVIPVINNNPVANNTANTSSNNTEGCTGSTLFSTVTGVRCTNYSAASQNKYVFSNFLNINSKGTEVSELQKRLTTLGFYSGPINGSFGPLTESAVKKFQKAKGITVAGYVGPSTRSALNKD